MKLFNQKPKNFVVRLDDTGYFSGSHPWRTMPFASAEYMTKKDAVKTWNRMSHRYYPQAVIEEILKYE